MLKQLSSAWIAALIVLPVAAQAAHARVQDHASGHSSTVRAHSPRAAFSYTTAQRPFATRVVLDAAGSSCGRYRPCAFRWEDDRQDGPRGVQRLLGTGRRLSYLWVSPGAKHVRLKVFNRMGRLVAKRGRTIEDTCLAAIATECVARAARTPAAIAVYSYSPSVGVVGSATAFDATGSACGSATPCSYRWEDDGSDGPGGLQTALGSGLRMSYTWTMTGTKNVRLKVYNRKRALKAQVVNALTVVAPAAGTTTTTTAPTTTTTTTAPTTTTTTTAPTTTTTTTAPTTTTTTTTAPTTTDTSGSGGTTTTTTMPTTGNLWVDPNGGSCTRQATAGSYSDAAACSFSAAYANAYPGDVILVKGGTYAGKDPGVNGTTEVRLDVNSRLVSATSDVTMASAPSEDVNVTADRFIVYGSHLRVRGATNPYTFHVRNLLVNATHGTSNANHDAFENLDGKSFFIGPVSDVTLLGGDYGPNNDSCNAPFGAQYEPHIDKINGWETGSQPTGLRPTNITLDGVTVHDQTSSDLTSCHTGGMIMADGNGIAIRHSKFYNNNVYDIEAGDTGSTPDNVTLEDNWFAPGTSQSGADAGQREVQFAQDGAFDNWLVRFNSFVHGLDIHLNRPSSTHSNMRVVGNIGESTDCGVSGVTYGYNAWVDGTCVSSEKRLSSLPYVKTWVTAPDLHLSGSPGSTPADNLVTQSTTDYATPDDIDRTTRGNTRDAGSDER